MNTDGTVGTAAWTTRTGGRHGHVPPARLPPPDSPLTRAARDAATRVLPATLLNHSLRTYRFGAALGELHGIEVDALGAHPREELEQYFARAWADEAARVPRGRARLMRRYGAFTTAIRLAPFDE